MGYKFAYFSWILAKYCDIYCNILKGANNIFYQYSCNFGIWLLTPGTAQLTLLPFKIKILLQQTE